MDVSSDDLTATNDLEKSEASSSLKFADETKMLRRVETRQEYHTLQDVLEQ